MDMLKQESPFELHLDFANKDISSSLSTQASRVFDRISPADTTRSGPPSAAQVIAAFKRKGLIPSNPKDKESSKKKGEKKADAVVNLCMKLAPAHCGPAAVTPLRAKILAVCFAASAYPQRSFQMDDEEEQPERVKSFLEVLCGKGQITNILRTLGRFPDDVKAIEIEQLLTDISAAETGPAGSSESRRLGAALYIATCYPKQIERICGNWRDDAALVCYVREKLISCPSELSGEYWEHKGTPRWGVVEQWLTKTYPEVDVNLHKAAIALEQKAWWAAGAWLDRPSGFAHQLIHAFWNKQMKKLMSGLPYYAFLSHLQQWWAICAAGEIPRLLNTSADNTPDIPDDNSVDENSRERSSEQENWQERLSQRSPELLRCSREGYRLVRSTFYTLPTKEISPEDDGKTLTAESGESSAEQKRSEDLTARNERHREMLDDIWRERMRKHSDEDEIKIKLRRIAKKFGVPENTVYTHNRRLRLKMGAYTLARLRRQTDSEILLTKWPHKRGQRSTCEYPLLKEPGILAIVYLARIIPPDRSFLWAFTAHIFLHSVVDPQHKDPWDFRRYLAELWHWETDPEFSDALARGCAQGSRADTEGLAILQKAPVANLVRILKNLPTIQDAAKFLAKQDRQDAAECVYNALLKVLDQNGLHAGCNACFKAFHKKKHWLVPLWYLATVERLGEEQALECMAVDEFQREEMRNLFRKMVKCRTCNLPKKAPRERRQEA